MKTQLPKISVVIPVRPGGDIRMALSALRKIDYPKSQIEVLVTSGLNPSRQRNLAVEKARGEIIYFLDNDSEVQKETFKRVIDCFHRIERNYNKVKTRGFSFFPDWISNIIIKQLFSGFIYQGEVGAVGGPNIWERKETFGASIASAILESFFAHFLMAARYRPIGAVHRATEKELILCNLAVKKNVFTEVGGFNEALYPNEENELLNRIELAGYQLVYHPGVLVHRPRRETMKDLLSAVFVYGRGRMEQIRIEGVVQSLPQLIPLFFVLYFVWLGYYLEVPGNYHWLALAPVIIYFLMGLGSAMGFAKRKKEAYLLIVLPICFFVFHSTYALGLIFGLTSNLRKKRENVRRGEIRVIKVI